ncbi:MAG: hypothetical protein ACRC37_04710 [Lentisphaeria bacterium]
MKKFFGILLGFGGLAFLGYIAIKNLGENEFFEGKTTEVFHKTAQNRAFEQSETSATSAVILKSKFSQNKLHDLPADEAATSVALVRFA